MIKKSIIALLLCLLLVGIVSAQEEQTPYEIALERIHEAEATTAYSLNLGGLELSSLPPEIGELRELQVLLLERNKLTELPTEIGQLENLLFLNVGQNNLRGFPASIGNLSKLERLSAYMNQIESLPPEFVNLQSLSHLELWQNEFTEFPLILTEIPSLHFFSIRSNHIRSIPPEIGRLRLCYFDIAYNQIERLPQELLEIEELLGAACVGNSYQDGLYWNPSGLRIAENPLIAPPQEVIAQGTPAILEYLRNEAWWHLQKLIVSGLASLGVVTLFVLGMRWKNTRAKQKRKNR